MGFPVDDGTWRDVLEAAAKLGITQGEIDQHYRTEFVTNEIRPHDTTDAGRNGPLPE